MKKFIFLMGPVVLIIVWFATSWLQIIDAFFLPNPLIVFERLFEVVFHGSILPDLFATLKRTLLSFVIAVVIGLPLGLLFGSSEKLYRSVEFVIDFFRSTPVTALVPLFLLIFGIADASKIAIATFAAVLIIIFNTAHGVMNASKSRILAAKIMGASKTQIFRWILFWESLPQTFIGLRTSISLALVIIVVTEMFIGTNIGLGRKIIDSQITYEIPTMYAAILLTGMLGYLLNIFFVAIERKYLHWVKQ